MVAVGARLACRVGAEVEVTHGIGELELGLLQYRLCARMAGRRPSASAAAGSAKCTITMGGSNRSLLFRPDGVDIFDYTTAVI